MIPCMDQGWAAIWAGIAALVGAGVGGGFAVWGAAIGGRKAVEAARQQVKDQAVTEHGHWLREQRQEAYLAFLRTLDGILTASGMVDQSLADVAEIKYEDERMGYPDGPGDPEDLLWAGMDQPLVSALAEMDAASDRLGMLGPASVVAAAAQARSAVAALLTAARQRIAYMADTSSEPGIPEWNTATDAVRARRQAFVERVHAVLTTPGSALG